MLTISGIQGCPQGYLLVQTQEMRMCIKQHRRGVIRSALLFRQIKIPLRKYLPKKRILQVFDESNGFAS